MFKEETFRRDNQRLETSLRVTTRDDQSRENGAVLRESSHATGSIESPNENVN